MIPRVISATIFIGLVIGWPRDLSHQRILVVSAILLGACPFLPPFLNVAMKVGVIVRELLRAAVNCFMPSLLGMGVGALVLLFRPESFSFTHAWQGYLTACCLAAWLNSYNSIIPTVDEKRFVITTACCGLLITACAIGGPPMAVLIGAAVCIVLT